MGNHREVHRQVSHPQAACDIDKDVFLSQFEPYALLQHGQQHVQSALVEACG